MLMARSEYLPMLLMYPVQAGAIATPIHDMPYYISTQIVFTSVSDRVVISLRLAFFPFFFWFL